LWWRNITTESEYCAFAPSFPLSLSPPFLLLSSLSVSHENNANTESEGGREEEKEGGTYRRQGLGEVIRENEFQIPVGPRTESKGASLAHLRREEGREGGREK